MVNLKISSGENRLNQGGPSSSHLLSSVSDGIRETYERIAGAGVWEYFPERDELRWSLQIYRIFDIDAVQAPSLEGWLDLHVEWARPILKAAFRKAIQNGIPFDMELQAESLSGQVLWLRIVCQCEGAESRARRLGGVVHDITEKKKAALLAVEHHRILGLLLNDMEGMAYRMDVAPPHAYHFLSRGCRHVTGKAARDLIQGTWLDFLNLVHPDDRQNLSKALQGALKERGAYHAVYRVLHPDGRTLWIEDRGYACADSPGAIQSIEGVLVDVTERQKLQETVESSAHLASLGCMVGGVVHDLRNILTPIILAAEAYEEGDAESIDVIRRSAGSAAALVQQILNFAGGSRKIHEMLCLQDSIRAYAVMAETMLPAGVRLELELPEDPVLIQADPVRLNQLLMNLCLNARDAIQEEGWIAVSLARLQEAKAAGLAWVVLTVRDSGCGMSEELKNSIFEPFVTTKAAGRGTGLGLDICRRVAEELGGRIECESEPGLGTAFHVYFPIPDGFSEARGKAAHPPGESGLDR